MTQIEPTRLKKLLRDCKVPNLDGNQSWESILQELVRLKVATSRQEEAVVLYLYQLETVGEKVWKNESDSLHWDFKKFIRAHEIYNPKRYEDCKVALDVTPFQVLKRIGLSAAVVITKNLNQKLYTTGFKAVTDYVEKTGQGVPPLDRVVLKLIKDVESKAQPKLRLVRQVRLHSTKVPKSKLDRAQERIQALEERVRVLEAERKVLKARIVKLEAGTKSRRKKVRAAA
jgi:hypothetical protein